MNKITLGTMQKGTTLAQDAHDMDHPNPRDILSALETVTTIVAIWQTLNDASREWN